MIDRDPFCRRRRRSCNCHSPLGESCSVLTFAMLRSPMLWVTDIRRLGKPLSRGYLSVLAGYLCLVMKMILPNEGWASISGY
ncbi:hypothetical protein BJX76DRAFT_332584 [Aspergillus varians]